MVIQKQPDDVANFLTQTNDLTSIFHHHNNQFLKFHFLPFLHAQERASLRATCQTIKNNIPISPPKPGKMHQKRDQFFRIEGASNSPISPTLS